MKKTNYEARGIADIIIPKIERVLQFICFILLMMEQENNDRKIIVIK